MTTPDTPPDEQRTSRPIASCALDDAGLWAQRERYARISANVLHVERDAAALSVSFAPQLERDVLERALEVERECCPFFSFELDEAGPRLRVTVTHEEELPALDVLADAFAGGPRSEDPRG